MVVVAPAPMVTVWQGGATNLGAQPKQMVCIPPGRSVETPPPSRATSSTLTVAGSSGLTATLRDPRGVKVPATTVAEPVDTVTVRGAGAVKPSTWVNATV